MMNSEMTTATKSTQRLRVMLHLKAGQTLTSLEALRLYGIMRLPNRISELRKRGERIEKNTITVLNKYGEAVRVAEYRLQDSETDRAGKSSKMPYNGQDRAAAISPTASAGQARSGKDEPRAGA